MSNIYVQRLMAKATDEQLMRVREAALRSDLHDLANAAERELRIRTTRSIEVPLRPYKATLHRI